MVSYSRARTCALGRADAVVLLTFTWTPRGLVPVTRDAGPWDVLPTSEGRRAFSTGRRRLPSPAAPARPPAKRVARAHFLALGPERVHDLALARAFTTFMASASPSRTTRRTASTAADTTSGSSVRSPGSKLESTQSATAPRKPGGGLPIPTRSRTKAGVPKR